MYFNALPRNTLKIFALGEKSLADFEKMWPIFFKIPPLFVKFESCSQNINSDTNSGRGI